jgi:hypothetical protein
MAHAQWKRSTRPVLACEWEGPGLGRHGRGMPAGRGATGGATGSRWNALSRSTPYAVRRTGRAAEDGRAPNEGAKVTNPVVWSRCAPVSRGHYFDAYEATSSESIADFGTWHLPRRLASDHVLKRPKV